MTSPEDLGNLMGETYTFGGDTWDLGDAGLAQLDEIIDSLADRIREAVAAAPDVVVGVAEEVYADEGSSALMGSRPSSST
jgi:hypothetical protein